MLFTRSIVVFTRSIRRKLASGLGFVVLLILLSLICSFMELSSYRRTVNDLELSTGKLPRRAELIASISQLFAPMNLELPGEQAPREVRMEAAEIQRDEFEDVLQKVRLEVDAFKLSWQQLDPKLRHNYDERPAYIHLFGIIDDGLYTIQRVIPHLTDLNRRPLLVREIGRNAWNMIQVAKNVPDPANRLGERLQEAKNEYLFHFRLASALSALSVVVLFGLFAWGHQLIFVPIRKLHQGVRRIADGDYGYRLNIDTQCEISQLANAFNEMGSRIQKDRASKEREIEERSKQLVLSERLAGAGFLASGVAHEINNPLSVIMTAAYGLEMRLGEDALSQLNEDDRKEVQEYLQLIQVEAERCERITKKLLDFSYGKGDERNLYDVTAIIDEVVSMVGHLSRYQDRHLTVDRTVPLHAWVNAPELKQVLLNLVANALDATGSGGHVDVLIRDSSEEVEITVKDDGCGMTQEQMRHIFEPFFTTKEVGKGTGLGLSISHRIVRDHGGTLQVHSDGPGQGSSFCLRLPKSAVKVRAA